MLFKYNKNGEKIQVLMLKRRTTDEISGIYDEK